MPGLDPGFTALPYRALGDAALSRAQRARRQPCRLPLRAGPLPGRPGPRRRRAGSRRRRGPRLRGAGVHGGAWGFASGVHLTADEAVRVAETAVAVAKVSAAMTTVPVEIAPEPVYDDVSGSRRTTSTRSRCRSPRRRRCWSTGPSGCAATPAVDHATAELLRCTRTSTTPTSPAPAPPSSGSGCMPAFTAMGADDSAAPSTT